MFKLPTGIPHMQIDSSQNYHNRPLGVFIEPVKQSLESYVQNVGHPALQLEPIIYTAIEEAIKSITAPTETRSPRILRQRVESIALVYIRGVLSQNRAWRRCRERIKSYYSVFLVGAGFSYGSDMPLSNILNDLTEFLGIKDWDELRKDAKKFLKFKTEFKALCDRKSPSDSHKLLIKNFPKYIYEIICLNWDDLLEKAAKQIGMPINKQNEDKPTTTERNIWKFHGDVENIKEDNIKGQGGWVLPDEQGYVFDSFLKYIADTRIKEKLFTFIIIGYNETEEVIYKKVISLLEHEKGNPRPTYRIGLELKNLNKENYIVGTADFTLNKILPISSVDS
jgi:hypothetical protein